MRTAQQQYLADKRRAKEHEQACDEQVAAVRAEVAAAQVHCRSRLEQKRPVHRPNCIGQHGYIPHGHPPS